MAIFAIARKLAILVYRMLRQGQDYVDLGEAHYEARFRQRRLDSLRHTATALGYTLIPATEITEQVVVSGQSGALGSR